MTKTILSILMILFCANISYAQILIDENFDDWDDIPVIIDSENDGTTGGSDFKSLQISNDDDYLYFKLELYDEILLQQENNITLLLDIDNNLDNGIEIAFEFGARDGVFVINSNDYSIRHDDIKLVILPSLSSSTFEISISRHIALPTGGQWNLMGDIKVIFADARTNGDLIPNNVDQQTYTIQENNSTGSTMYQFDKVGEGFRLMTYNSLFDGLFESGQSQAQKRMIKSVAADIYAFVEIYNHSSQQIAAIVNDLVPLNNSQWYNASEGSDTHVISKYPIIDHTNIDGNGAYLIDYLGTDILMIVAHLPAGSNDYNRQQEVDKIIAFIRDAKQGANEFQLVTDAPIIITGDMNLYGKRRQRETLLTGDIKYNSSFGSDSAPDWDDTDLTASLPFATGLPQAVTWISPSSSFFPGRLDYTIYSDHILNLKNSYCLNTNTMSTTEINSHNLQQNDSRSGSDHIPVITDFELKSVVSNVDVNIIGIKIYPNPTAKYISLSDQSIGKLVQIYNISGQLIYNHICNESNDHIDLQEHNNGIYYITITDTDNNQVIFSTSILLSK